MGTILIKNNQIKLLSFCNGKQMLRDRLTLCIIRNFAPDEKISKDTEVCNEKARATAKTTY
ncbi:MAG: hypothetical protein SAK29_26365 [Scytonema sp. PMC 1069.18]|nr:hypothetical protein [Scytonema sp. PMC 1069.18]MEC4884747.1 hypothetical protein [Scytonema sp. PMC 1070.18]